MARAAKREALIKTCRSAGEAWAGPGLAVRARARVSGARVRLRAGILRRLGVVLGCGHGKRVARGTDGTRAHASCCGSGPWRGRVGVGVRVTARAKGARVSGAGGCTLAPPPPPGCRGTTTVGRGGLHHARGRLQRPKTSAGEAGAGPRLAVRVRARVKGLGLGVGWVAPSGFAAAWLPGDGHGWARRLVPRLRR